MLHVKHLKILKSFIFLEVFFSNDIYNFPDKYLKTKYYKATNILNNFQKLLFYLFIRMVYTLYKAVMTINYKLKKKMYY